MKMLAHASARIAVALSLGLVACQAGNPTSPRDTGIRQTGVRVPDGSSITVEGNYVILSVTDGEAVAITGEVPDAESLEAGYAAVFFTDARGRYMVVQDASEQRALISARVKPEGSRYIFETPAVFPAGIQVFPSVILPGNRRLVGFGTTAQNQPIAIDVGSTYVIESLRALSRARNVSVESVITQPGRAVGLQALIAQASAGVKSEILLPPGDPEAPSFLAGSEQEIASTFISRFLAFDRPAREICQTWFSDPVRPLVTFAGNFLNTSASVQGSTRSVEVPVAGPVAVTLDKKDPSSVFVAEGEQFRMRRIQLDGTLFPFIGEGLGDASAVRQNRQISPDESALEAGLRIDDIREVRSDDQGNLAMTFNAEPIIAFLCRESGTYFGRPMVADKLYRLGDYTPEPTAEGDWPDNLEGYTDGPLAEARFKDPSGLSFDDRGNLFVADRRNNRIRMIQASGSVVTVIGDGYSNRVELGRVIDQPAGPNSGLRASLNRPISVVWRKAGTNQELYIYDNLNNVIRRAVAPYEDSFRNGLVETFAGTVASGSVIPSQDSTASVEYYGDTGVMGYQDGYRLSAKFHFADNIPQRQVFTNVWSGLALDATRNRLYVPDSLNRAIRMIDLTTDQVSTVARHGLEAIDGDARSVQLSNNLAGLTVLQDGSVLICDRGNHVVRRLIMD